MLNYKTSVFFIAIGLLSTIVSYVILNNLYQTQSQWIKADVDLYKVKVVDPLTENIDDKGYYGEYLFTINDTTLHLFSEKVSDSRYVETKITFYINPNNYKEYHPAYNKNTKYVSLLGLGFCIIGLIDFFNLPRKKIK